MSGNRDERIRQRAHTIWDSEGRPEGAAQRHWQQAEQEIDQEDKAAEKKPAAKKAAAPKKPKAEGASRKTAGAGPAVAKRSKDATKPAKG